MHITCNQAEETDFEIGHFRNFWTPSRWVSRNTAPLAPRAPHWNIVKISKRWCLSFNWISSKISRKRWIGEVEELTKGRNVQLLAVQVYSQCGARGVRGARSAVFRDIASRWSWTESYIGIVSLIDFYLHNNFLWNRKKLFAGERMGTSAFYSRQYFIQY